jgi:tripartite-type tricarboxylate transporter receptor subunit TctC
LLLLAIVMAGGVRAQLANYPDRPVRIISNAAPGGAIDTNLRIIAEGLSKKWVRQVVIENRPGTGGAISATAAAQAPPNGLQASRCWCCSRAVNLRPRRGEPELSGRWPM